MYVNEIDLTMIDDKESYAIYIFLFLFQYKIKPSVVLSIPEFKV